MKNKNVSDVENLNVIAFFFDISKIDNLWYGNVVFEKFIDGYEVTKNSSKMIISLGDVLNYSIYDDISPFLINNHMCTIDKRNRKYTSRIYVCLVEDIDTNIAKEIDGRLKQNFPAYVGMTSVNIESTDKRKQFWKMLIRHHSIEENVITYFTMMEEDCFNYIETAENKGFIVTNDGFFNYTHHKKNGELYSTRQSSFIRHYNQLEPRKGKSDLDRGLTEMNFALGQELEVAGLQIWKSVEDISNAYISKNEQHSENTAYIFTSMYQASQGVERLLKIILTLEMYISEDNTEKQKISNLVFEHNHITMYDFIAKTGNYNIEKNARKMLQLLSNFYLKYRYNRFSACKNMTKELSILLKFGENIDENNFDDKIKSLYGQSLGKISQHLYEIICNLCSKINIFSYELNANSVSAVIFSKYYGYNLYEIMKQRAQSKKEFIWYLIQNGKETSFAKKFIDLPPLELEECDIPDYLNGIILNNNKVNMLHDFVSESYDSLVENDKENWKNRIDIIELLDKDIFFSEEEY